MARSFQDHFGGHGDAYAAARPTYPASLYAWVASQSPATRAVWDCGTGSGQAAVGLAAHFDEVVATDPSAGQLAHATPHPRVRYHQAPAEASGLTDASVDAVTVAEALHWFDHDAFYAEVRRVVRPGGLVACWGYRGHEVCPGVDDLIDGFREAVEPYWPPGRELLDAGYTTVPFPFEELAVPAFEMRQTWRADDLIAYLHTWSSVKRCVAAGQPDPVVAAAPALRAAWGPGARDIVWPLLWRCGRLPHT